MLGRYVNVDSSDDPGAAGRWLEEVARRPFFADLKRRGLSQLMIRNGSRVLDVGCGPGVDHAVIAGVIAGGSGTLIGLDRSKVMLHLAKKANAGTDSIRYVQANVEHLPYLAYSFDASRAERVLQYVERPSRAIGELVRVTRQGGRILACDPDHESLVIDHPSLDVWRKVKNFRTDLTRPNGIGAHQLRRLFLESGLIDVAVEVKTLYVTRMDEAFGCETWGRRALRYGALSKRECEEWESGLGEFDRAGLFTYTINYYSVVGTRP